MASYRFVTVWQVRAPIDRVWDAIYEAEKWPLWWKGVVRVSTLRSPDAHGLGGLTRYVWKSALPYKLTIETTATRMDRPSAMDGHSTGELQGEGRWRLSQQADLTTVRYEWDVSTTKPWMNLLAPLLKPAFAWNHDVVMRQGGDGLRRLLEEPLPKVSGFEPERLARLETEIWRAYYERRWWWCYWLTKRLMHEQFGLSWHRSFAAAYGTTVAAIAWARPDHDAARVRRSLIFFYRQVRRYGRGLTFQPQRAAGLELAYWVAHRELSGRPEADKGRLEDSLTELHAELFGLPQETTRESGVARARAADVVDEITGRRSTDLDLDWARVERHLRDCYGSIARALAQIRR